MNQGTYQIVAKVRATRKGQVRTTSKGTKLGGKGSDGRHWYDISKAGKGLWACSCPAYKFRHADLGTCCKHMLYLFDQVRTGGAYVNHDIQILDGEAF